MKKQMKVTVKFQNNGKSLRDIIKMIIIHKMM